jgi:phospholipid transport system substrate-binding protein
LNVRVGNRTGVVTAALAVALELGGPAWASSPTEQLRAYTDRVMEVLESRTTTAPERLEAVRAVASEAFDVSETAQRALGLHWQQRTPAERQEFVQIFRGLLEQTYRSRIGEFGGERIKYLDERIDGDRAIVRAVIDILIENISLIARYRSQFDRVIRTASYPELVRRFKTRGAL